MMDLPVLEKKTMRAIYIEQHQPVDQLTVREVPIPAAKSGDVLVEIEAAGINPSDVASVEGRFPNAVLPRIVGRDFAGKVVKGEAALIGAEVWGSGGDLGITRNGTHAEYLAISSAAIAPRPRNLTPEEAAVIGVPFVTAFSALLRLGQLKKGEWVIVSGAAGAVGQAAIQLARHQGAHVIALIRNASEQRVANLAVEAIAESEQGNLEEVARRVTGGRGADLALNGVGASVFAALLGALATGGRMVVYSAAGGREFPLDILSFYRNQNVLLGLDTQKLDARACAGILKEIAPWFESGALKSSVVAERVPLTDATAAYGRVAAGKAGKIVLIMDGTKASEGPHETAKIS